jgi:hypothetical protein
MREGICLEAVDVSAALPRRIEGAWISPSSLHALLDRLLAKEDGDLGEPSMAWLSRFYFYDPGGPPSEGDPETIRLTSAEPLAEQCVEPAEVLAALRWVREAVAKGGPLNRQDVWTLMGFGGPHDPDRFARAFDADIDSWTRICDVASSQARGRVILRVDA